MVREICCPGRSSSVRSPTTTTLASSRYLCAQPPPGFARLSRPQDASHKAAPGRSRLACSAGSPPPRCSPSPSSPLSWPHFGGQSGWVFFFLGSQTCSRTQARPAAIPPPSAALRSWRAGHSRPGWLRLGGAAHKGCTPCPGACRLLCPGSFPTPLLPRSPGGHFALSRRPLVFWASEPRFELTSL